ncbi:MAG: preprotein translocase subunit SecG [Verrucomicrobia bacterium]|nr:MAG: preprotein translocase subunit SecG [Verrucomicrobiota bacterium]
MSFIIGLLTVILVLDCLLLLLLILIQLPKKEAGAGVAFGGGATDALFGAGSGTALTKITKYSAGVFLGLSLLLSVMRANQANEGGRKFEEELKRKAAAGPVIPPALAPANSMTSTAAAPAALPLLQPSNPAKTNPAAGPEK